MLWAIVVIILSLFALVVYSCLAMAAKADQWEEEHWEEELEKCKELADRDGWTL